MKTKTTIKTYRDDPARVYLTHSNKLLEVHNHNEYEHVVVLKFGGHDVIVSAHDLARAIKKAID